MNLYETNILLQIKRAGFFEKRENEVIEILLMRYILQVK